MRKFLAISLAVLVISAVAAAQIPTSGNIFVGYSYSGGDVFSSCFPSCGASIGTLQPPSRSANFNGWEGSLEGKFLPWIGVVTDVSQRYGSQNFNFVCTLPPGSPACPSAPLTVNARVLTVLFGPRVSVSVGKFTPFAHALVGVGHISDSQAASNSDTAFATAIGGGLDYKLIKGLAWRVQGDELHTRFFNGTQDHFRFSTGIVFRF